MTRLGNVPLMVLTGQLYTNHLMWQDWQAELPGLSTNSQHRFAEKSGHGIQQDEPEPAADAIVKMVQQGRAAARR